MNIKLSTTSAPDSPDFSDRQAASISPSSPNRPGEESASFDRQILDYIHRASSTGLYEIRGLGAKRRVPHFDDLLLLAASLSRYPL